LPSLRHHGHGQLLDIDNGRALSEADLGSDSDMRPTASPRDREQRCRGGGTSAGPLAIRCAARCRRRSTASISISCPHAVVSDAPAALTPRTTGRCGCARRRPGRGLPRVSRGSPFARHFTTPPAIPLVRTPCARSHSGYLAIPRRDGPAPPAVHAERSILALVFAV